MQVNGHAARASLRLKAGDRVVVELPDTAVTSPLVPEPIPLTIVHEDDDVLVLDKPAGLVVHPGAGVHSGTLVHGLLHRDPTLAGVGSPFRPGLVHRLDRDTSGLMVVARTPRAYLTLVTALRDRRVKRIYSALAWGDPKDEDGTVDAPIGRDPKLRQRMAVVRRGGKPAITHWRVVERFPPFVRLKVALESGRTHQIRVHLAHIGMPVVGDPVYRGRTKNPLSVAVSRRSLVAAVLDALPRQALHASELSFQHPATGAILSFTSPLPADFAAALALLRGAADGPRT